MHVGCLPICLDLFFPIPKAPPPVPCRANFLWPFLWRKEGDNMVQLQCCTIRPQEGGLWMKNWFGWWGNEWWWFIRKAHEHWCLMHDELIFATYPIPWAFMNVDGIQALGHGYIFLDLWRPCYCPQHNQNERPACLLPHFPTSKAIDSFESDPDAHELFNQTSLMIKAHIIMSYVQMIDLVLSYWSASRATWKCWYGT